MAERDYSPRSTATDLDETFKRAASHLVTLSTQLDPGQLLGFYGLYKQATCGPCDTPRPNWYQIQAKHKWESWKSLGEMSKEVAMSNYIRAVGKVDPNWQESLESSTQDGGGWIAVSKLSSMDAELRDVDKTFLDWIKDGNEKKVLEFLTRDPSCVSQADQDGMLPIHWAADRGHVPIMKCLIEADADINSRDRDGQTPLHYVASCGHVEGLQYLLSVGAAENIEDKDGLLPKNVAEEQLRSMFSNV